MGESIFTKPVLRAKRWMESDESTSKRKDDISETPIFLPKPLYIKRLLKF
jgi:hypothetical protein